MRRVISFLGATWFTPLRSNKGMCLKGKSTYEALVSPGPYTSSKFRVSYTSPSLLMRGRPRVISWSFLFNCHNRPSCLKNPGMQLVPTFTHQVHIDKKKPLRKEWFSFYLLDEDGIESRNEAAMSQTAASEAGPHEKCEAFLCVARTCA